MSVSVIIPAYNAAETIGRCLDSLQKCVDDDVEIIVVDNRSSDETRAVAAQFQHVNILTESKPSAGACRNRGAGKAKFDTLLFLDADIQMTSSAWQRLLGQFREQQSNACVYGVFAQYTDVRNFFSLYKHHLFLSYQRRRGRRSESVVSACLMIGKRQFQAIGGFNDAILGATIEDVDLGLRLHRADIEVVFVPDLEIYHSKRYGFRSLLITQCTRAYKMGVLTARAADMDGIRHSGYVLSVPLWFALSLPAAATAVLALGTSVVYPPVLAPAILLAIVVVFVHHRFISEMVRDIGRLYLVPTLLFLQLDLAFSFVVACIGWVVGKWTRQPLT